MIWQLKRIIPKPTVPTYLNSSPNLLRHRENLKHVQNDLHDKKIILQNKTNKLEECEKRLKKLDKGAETKLRKLQKTVEEKEAIIMDLKKKICGKENNAKWAPGNQVCYVPLAGSEPALNQYTKPATTLPVQIT